jgi:hypothetical protein
MAYHTAYWTLRVGLTEILNVVANKKNKRKKN